MTPVSACQPHLLWCPPCFAAFGGTFSCCRHVTALPWQPYSCLSQTILWIKRSLRSLPAEWISCWMHCRARWQMSVTFFYLFFCPACCFCSSMFLLVVRVCSPLSCYWCHHYAGLSLKLYWLTDRSRRWSQRWGICNIIMIFLVVFFAVSCCSILLFT